MNLKIGRHCFRVINGLNIYKILVVLFLLTFPLLCQSQESQQKTNSSNNILWKHYMGMGAGNSVGIGLLYRIEYRKFGLQVLNGYINQYGLEASYNSISTYYDFVAEKKVKFYIFSAYLDRNSILSYGERGRSITKNSGQFALGLGLGVFSGSRFFFAIQYGIGVRTTKPINRFIYLVDLQLVYKINRRLTNEK